MRSMICIALIVGGCVQELATLTPVDGGPTSDVGQDEGSEPDATDARPPDSGVEVPEGPTLMAADAHSCAINNGALVCWGSNESGQLGRPGPSTTRAVQVDSARTWVELSGRGATTCGRTDDRRVWCWGRNVDGQLGRGDFADSDQPISVELEEVIQVRSGYHSACAIDRAGAAFCWGQDFEGQVAIGSRPDAPDQPLPLPVAEVRGWVRLSVGQGHACGVAAGSTWCWGRNTSRQLGLGAGSPSQTRVPTRVDSVPFAHVVAGQNHTCALTEEGALYCWGGNTFGQLGTGDMLNAESPRLIDAGPFQQIDADTFHSCAIRSGELLCWGSEFIGAPQDNLQPTPVLVDERNDWVEVRTGRFHTCARRRDGSVWCRGENRFGQLGAGDGGQENNLVQVMMPGPI